MPRTSPELSLSDRIRLAFHATKDLTMYRLSQETGLSEPTIGRIIGGKVEPSLANAEILLNHFGFTITDPASIDTPAKRAAARRKLRSKEAKS